MHETTSFIFYICIQRPCKSTTLTTRATHVPKLVNNYKLYSTNVYVCVCKFPWGIFLETVYKIRC